MDRLPDELLLRIFRFLVDDIQQLLMIGSVSSHFYSITQDPNLWYLAFKKRYPIWGSRVKYAVNAHPLIDWKDFMIHLMKQQKATHHFSFEFIQEQLSSFRKRKRQQQAEEDEDEEQQPFWIQDPLVVDMDRITQQGVVATGKHRKITTGLKSYSEHKILFWDYPSWKLIRSFELVLTPPTLTCQIIGIQSIRMPTPDGGTQQMRFFSLAVGIALMTGMEAEHEDRVDIWKSLFVYRLLDDGSTQCVAHLKVADLFLGREVFLFSDTSWSGHLNQWLQIVSPAHVEYDPCYTVFLLAIGPIYDRITGCVQLARFDIRDPYVLDPSVTPVAWDHLLHQLVPQSPRSRPRTEPTEMIASIRLGSDVSCMIHFKYPPYLNHLICTGSYQDDELSVYDWRFGIKVGSLPWKTSKEEDEAVMDVRPWGLESTLVLPPCWPSQDAPLAHHGFRLIAVGDNRSDTSRDKLEIKVWDISYLLQVAWDPFDARPIDGLTDTLQLELAHRFSWWPRRTQELTRLALAMHTSTPDTPLPYSPPEGCPSMLLTHTFEHDETIPVKYTAYNVLYTSLFLLTEDGKVTVMDIETGKITGTVDNVAANGNGQYSQVRGIDVNVIGGKEVVVTSKEGLLRGIVF